MSKTVVTIPHDPDARLKASVRYYALSRLRKASGKPLTLPVDADEDFALSVQMFDSDERKQLFKLHASYLKLMRLTGQLPPGQSHKWPPAPYGR